ncbi:MAG: glycosyltransferase [Saprospiraceae bacterium]|nr:MAG: glycosyltransferase [Saprospiraceae bacterium]
MKKIICTVTNDLVYDQRMIRICNSLTKAGYQVRLVGRKKHNSPTLPSLAFDQRRLSCFFQKGKWFYLEYNLRLFFYLLVTPYDLICAIDLDTLGPGYFTSKLKGKICVYDAHEYFTETPEVVRRPWIQRIWAALARLIIPRLKYAYTVGDQLAQLFEKQYGIPFTVIRNVPHASPQHAVNSSKEIKVLLYQGALNEGRGLEVTIQAMQYLPNVELWLAGEGDLSEALRQMTEDLKLTDRVKFLGYIRPEELKSLTKQAYIGLNLLENNGLSYYYSLANKAFDYIQAGIPSLHMDFPEYRNLQDQYEVFLLADRLEATYIAQLIQHLLQHPDLYQKLQHNCHQAAKTLNWAQEEQRLLRFYKNIVW